MTIIAGFKLKSLDLKVNPGKQFNATPIALWGVATYQLSKIILIPQFTNIILGYIHDNLL